MHICRQSLPPKFAIYVVPVEKRTTWCVVFTDKLQNRVPVWSSPELSEGGWSGRTAILGKIQGNRARLTRKGSGDYLRISDNKQRAILFRMDDVSSELMVV